MGKVRLRVLTVPAIDPVTYNEHTTFCVSSTLEGQFQFAPGWTLRDAVENFCTWFKVDRQSIILERPFLPQSEGKDDYK